MNTWRLGPFPGRCSGTESVSGDWRPASSPGQRVCREIGARSRCRGGAVCRWTGVRGRCGWFVAGGGEYVDTRRGGVGVWGRGSLPCRCWGGKSGVWGRWGERRRTGVQGSCRVGAGPGSVSTLDERGWGLGLLPCRCQGDGRVGRVASGAVPGSFRVCRRTGAGSVWVRGVLLLLLLARGLRCRLSPRVVWQRVASVAHSHTMLQTHPLFSRANGTQEESDDRQPITCHLLPCHST